MSEYGGLWKNENNQHAIVPPKTECGYTQVAEKLKTVTYATPPPMEERRKKMEAIGLRFLQVHERYAGASVYVYLGLIDFRENAYLQEEKKTV